MAVNSSPPAPASPTRPGTLRAGVIDQSVDGELEMLWATTFTEAASFSGGIDGPLTLTDELTLENALTGVSADFSLGVETPALVGSAGASPGDVGLYLGSTEDDFDDAAVLVEFVRGFGTLSEEVVATILSTGALRSENGWSEEIEIESMPFTVDGLPLGIGWQYAGSSWYGLSAWEFDSGGPLGTISQMSLGQHRAALVDEVEEVFAESPDNMASPMLQFVEFNSGGESSARLNVTDVYLGMDSDGTSPALELLDGRDNPQGVFNVPVWFGGYDPAITRVTLGDEVGGWLTGLVDGEMEALGSYAVSAKNRNVVHIFDGANLNDLDEVDLSYAHVFAVNESFVEDYLGVFGSFASGDFLAALRVHKSGALERERYVAAADAGTQGSDLGQGYAYTHDAGAAPTGIFTEPQSSAVERIVVQSAAVKADSIITAFSFGRRNLPGTNKSADAGLSVSHITEGSFRINLEAIYPDSFENAWAIGSGGNIAWSVER